MSTRRYWMVCDVGSSWGHPTPCLFDEETALKRGDPPRCIRHGALLLNDTTLTGLTRDEARKRIRESK